MLPQLKSFFLIVISLVYAIFRSVVYGYTRVLSVNRPCLFLSENSGVHPLKVKP
jgi:hypothetical protein